MRLEVGTARNPKFESSRGTTVEPVVKITDPGVGVRWSRIRVKAGWDPVSGPWVAVWCAEYWLVSWESMVHWWIRLVSAPTGKVYKNKARFRLQSA